MAEEISSIVVFWESVTDAARLSYGVVVREGQRNPKKPGLILVTVATEVPGLQRSAGMWNRGEVQRRGTTARVNAAFGCCYDKGSFLRKWPKPKTFETREGDTNFGHSSDDVDDWCERGEQFRSSMISLRAKNSIADLNMNCQVSSRTAGS